MSLLNLLYNFPNNLEGKGPGGPSKGIIYIPNQNSYQFNKRDEWDTTDSEISKWLKKHDMNSNVIYIRESTRELIKTLKDEI